MGKGGTRKSEGWEREIKKKGKRMSGKRRGKGERSGWERYKIEETMLGWSQRIFKYEYTYM